MSHPNLPGNGCSLEDCHTNLFALTDLSGIKWRKLTASPDYCSDLLEDPVLSSFTKCVQSDLLCVWRRSPREAGQKIQESLGSCHKELWLFWYGEKPSNLDSLLSRQLKDSDTGSWDNGLSYECRTLLFRALHNLIERCLLSKDFVRLGKWFVQPYDNSNAGVDRSSHLSISFSFFLHGESTVCASIDVRHHPPVWKLTQQQLSVAKGSQNGLNVILAPYGLSGKLTGISYKNQEEKFLEDWKNFYPMPCEAADDGNKLPRAVEVIVGGVKMRYPTSFVLVAESSSSRALNGATTSGVVSATSQDGDSLPGETNITVMSTSGYADNMTDSRKKFNPHDDLQLKVLEQVWQDLNQTKSKAAPKRYESEEETNVGFDTFSDPVQRSTCSCSKCKTARSRFTSGQGKGTSSKSEHKLERQFSKQSRLSTPFHRRSPVSEILQRDSDMLVTHTHVAEHHGHYTSNLPQLRGSEFDGSHHIAESPRAGVPSPLVVPQGRPPSIGHIGGDPTMPTLSPQPPTAKQPDKDVDRTSNLCSAESQETKNCNNSDTSNNVGANTITKSAAHVDSGHANVHMYGKNAQSVNSWLESQQKRRTDNLGLKRPMLPTSECDSQDVAATDSLYTFSTLNSWLNYPVKRYRAEPALRVHDVKPPTSSSHGPPARSSQPSPAPIADPYDFADEETPGGAAKLGGIRGYRKSRDYSRASLTRQDELGQDTRQKTEKSNENEESPTTPGVGSTSLMRESDIVPKASDLDHMFDTDDDDDAFQAPTPNSMRMPDDFQRHTKQAHLTNTGTIGQAELSRMFPTPPSAQEANTALSPCNDSEPMVTEPALQHIKTERGLLLNTQVSDKVKCVTVAVLPTSSKYSPIDLPSAKLSPIRVPESLSYRPSFQYSMDMMVKTAPSHILPVPSIEMNNMQAMQRMQTSMDRTIDASPVQFTEKSPITAYTSRSPAAYPGHSPAAFQGTVHSPYPGSQQRTPISYELQSPASNASSYMNKNLSSVDPQGTNTQLPEISSLLMNIILSDSLLNMFKDQNFDSCNICVCNMNIKGADMGVYLVDKSGQVDPQYKCTCGFSAVVNRRLGYSAGLFYEDEVDITGIRDEKYERKKPSLLAIDPKDGASAPIDDNLPQDLLALIRSMFTTPFYSFSELKLPYKSQILLGAGSEFIEMQDGCGACYSAVEQCRQSAENVHISSKLDESFRNSLLHKWAFHSASSTSRLKGSQRVQALKCLQPLLQDALHKKLDQRLWERPYRISGPMTWKDFHLLAGRGSEEASEPQPIPTVLVGHDKDWASMSPQSLLFWDKLLLEPYSKPKDIVYVVVSPENDYILANVNNYFKEISKIYELCNLGRHCPLDKSLRDGVFRVKQQFAKKLPDGDVDAWFQNIGNSPVALKLKLIAQVCKHYLAPFLSSSEIDSSVFESGSGGKDKSKETKVPQSAPSPAPPPTPEQSVGTPKNTTEVDKDKEKEEPQQKDFSLDLQQEEAEGPALVIYIVDPFTFGCDWGDAKRLAMLGLLRCYQELKNNLPDSLKNNVYLQIVPLECILDHMSSTSRYNQMKLMAFSVYSQCKRHLSRSIMGRSLTGFGPAAAAEKHTRKQPTVEPQNNRVFNTPFILSPQQDTQSALTESCGDGHERSAVLFCSYCLSEDQRWLIAVCTDDRGEMLETCTINIDIPNRNRRKKASARKIGLQKLLDFIIGLMSTTNSPWRLVIGRLGRLGHGELKGWASLLSRRSLQRMSRQLRDICDMCRILPNHDIPCIYSACLISLEPLSTLNIWVDSVKPEERKASNIMLNTPTDASVTHILVFPTSATAQANTQAFQQQTQMDIEPFGNMDLDNLDLVNGLQDDIGIGPDFDQLFGMTDMHVDLPQSPGKDGMVSMPNSPGGHMNSGSTSNQNMIGKAQRSMSSATDIQDESPNLLQQPLAMGYYISTAKTGPLPKWFWSSCPLRRDSCPAHFKSALHVNCPSLQQNQDDIFHQAHQRHSHPLDSSVTCDVLRYVLERYNSLSWLTYDLSAGERRSCLPVHFLVLMQLYHAMNTYV